MNTMLKKQLDTIKNTFKHLLLYEFCYLLAVSLIVVPTVMYLYTTCIRDKNISSLPILYFSILIIFLVLAILFNKISLVTYLDFLQQKKKISKKEIFQVSVSRLSILLKKKNIAYFLLYLLFITFSYLTIFEFFTINFLKLLNVKANIILVAVLFYTIVILFLFKYIFFSNYLILDNKNNKNYLKASSKLIKNNISKDIGNVLGVNLIMVPVLLIVLLMNNLAVTTPFLSSSEKIVDITWIVLWSVIILFLSIYVILVNTVMSMVFYSHKKEKHEINSKIKKTPSINWLFIPRIIKVTVIIFAVLFTSYGIFQEKEKSLEEPHKVEITGHRGASMDYPENTMLAFKGAKLEGADWIELDVRVSKDNQYVIHHDDTVYRMTGYSGLVGEMNYSDLCELDCGSLFDTKYAGEKIPLLEDAIKYAKDNKMRVILDLKNDLDNINYYEQDIINIINKYNYADYCVLETPFYKQIRNIKRINPRIKTAYLLDYMSEDYLYLDDADIISLNAISVNSYWINKVHESGKEIFVWTINDPEAIKQFIELGVDNLMTDDVDLAKAIQEGREIEDLEGETATS